MVETQRRRVAFSCTAESRSTRRVPFLARAPLVGLTLAACGALVFSVLALNVRRNGRLVSWDVLVSQAIHRREVRNSPRLISVIRVIASLGRELALAVTAWLALDWLGRRDWRRLTMLLVGVIGGNTWFEVLSRFFGRHRPEFPDLDHVIAGPGFPSGHTMTAVTLYGLLLYLRLPQMCNAGQRRLAALGSALLVLGVGFSRLYLCAHFLTDVLAGYAFGLFWAALTYTGIEVYFHRYWAK